VLERVLDQLGSAGSADLLLDVRAVGLDRTHAQIQLTGDLAVRVAERDQAQDLDLTLGQVVGRPGRSGRLSGKARAEARIQLRLTVGR
jgi:hypothetical protein